MTDDHQKFETVHREFWGLVFCFALPDSAVCYAAGAVIAHLPRGEP